MKKLLIVLSLFTSILGFSQCFHPINVISLNKTNASVDLEWDFNNSNLVEIKYGDPVRGFGGGIVGISNSVTVKTSANGITLNNLLPAKRYYAQIRSVCNNNVPPTIISFTAKCPNPLTTISIYQDMNNPQYVAFEATSNNANLYHYLWRNIKAPHNILNIPYNKKKKFDCFYPNLNDSTGIRLEMRDVCGNNWVYDVEVYTGDTTTTVSVLNIEESIISDDIPYKIYTWGGRYVGDNIKSGTLNGSYVVRYSNGVSKKIFLQ